MWKKGEFFRCLGYLQPFIQQYSGACISVWSHYMLTHIDLNAYNVVFVHTYGSTDLKIAKSVLTEQVTASLSTSVSIYLTLILSVKPIHASSGLCFSAFTLSVILFLMGCHHLKRRVLFFFIPDLFIPSLLLSFPLFFPPWCAVTSKCTYLTHLSYRDWPPSHVGQFVFIKDDDYSSCRHWRLSCIWTKSLPRCCPCTFIFS